MNLDRIATLLSQGLKPSQVASIVGCVPARITQISQQEDFKLILADKMALAEKDFTEAQALDAKYLNLEHKIIQQIEDTIPSAELRDVTAALRVITERQFRKQQFANPIQAGTVNVQQNIVQLTLPQNSIPAFTANKENEIIAINGQTIAPLSSQGVESLFKKMKGIQNEPERILAVTEEGAPATQTEEVTQ